MSRSIVVDIKISRDEYLRWYQGTAQDVLTSSVDGRSVRFPAKILQPFVSHEGIQGRFQIQFDDKGKFTHIKKLS